MPPRKCYLQIRASKKLKDTWMEIYLQIRIEKHLTTTKKIGTKKRTRLQAGNVQFVSKGTRSAQTNVAYALNKRITRHVNLV